MKSRMAWKWLVGLGLSALLVPGCSRREAASSEQLASGNEAEPTAEEAFTPPDVVPEEVMAVSAPAPATDISSAAPTAMVEPVSPPPVVRTTGPLADAIKLVHAGVDESLLLAYVTNSPSTFNLRPEEIIYLNDLGVPPAVVTAMMEHDRMLQEMPAPMTVAAPPPTVAPAAVPVAAAPVQPDQPVPEYPVDSPPPQPEPVDVGAYPVFYDNLAPYGTWLNLEGYGACWRPTVAVVNGGWRPYCDRGHWVYTDCGWYWLSDYSWGWAPFHYGRWFQHQALGWCWMPANVWGPAWVCWRYSGQYCGWAPLPPGVSFTAGRGLTVHGQVVPANATLAVSAASFAFVPIAHLSDRQLPPHALGPEQVNRLITQTTVSTAILSHGDNIVNPGIPRDRVTAITHMAIRPLPLHDVTVPPVPGQRIERLDPNGHAVAVYRPVIPQAPTPRVPRQAAGVIAYGGTERTDDPLMGETTAPALAGGAPINLGGASPPVRSPAGASGTAMISPGMTPNPVVTIGRRPLPQAPYRAPTATMPPRIQSISAGAVPSVAAQSQSAGSTPEIRSSLANQDQPVANPVRWPAPFRWPTPDTRAAGANVAERQPAAPDQRPPEAAAYSAHRVTDQRMPQGTMSVPRQSSSAQPAYSPAPNFAQDAIHSAMLESRAAQAAARPAPIEVPRYAPAPSFAREPVHSAPVIEPRAAAPPPQPAPAPVATPAPVAHAAPAAPAASVSQSQSSSGKNPR